MLIRPPPQIIRPSQAGGRIAGQGFGFPHAGRQAQPPDTGGGGGGYVAKAVHFNPGGSFNTLFQGLLSSNGNFSSVLFSGWVANIPTGDPDIFVYIADDNNGININQNAASDFAVIGYSDPAGQRTLLADSSDFLLPITPWTHVAVSAYQPTQEDQMQSERPSHNIALSSMGAWRWIWQHHWR